MWGAFAVQKLLTLFQQKMIVVLQQYVWKCKVSIAKDVVCFEQLGIGQMLS